MTTFSTSREIPATVEQVFAAFSEPARLARWWGPAGFSNTFGVCEFRKGGRWLFVMHGPDGRNYPNESVFEEVEPPGKIVVRHVSEPKYRLTIVLNPSAAGTLVSWSRHSRTLKWPAASSILSSPPMSRTLTDCRPRFCIPVRR